MFTVDGRESLRREVLAWALADPDVVGAASIGSRARGAEDQWSDVDLALQLAPGTDRSGVVARFTHRLSARGVADTLDMPVGDVLYRVFLMSDGLQLDLSFFPHEAFRASYGEPMVAHFGQVLAPEPALVPDWRPHASMAWLYLAHARSAIGRRRWWQADLMLGDVRAELLWLAAFDAGLNPHHGRQAHLLPTTITDALARSRPGGLDAEPMDRAHLAAVAAFELVVSPLDEALARAVVAALRPSN